MNTFLMWFGGLLIAIFAALFAGPHFIDWNSYRGVFEEEATRLLGRRVRVGGNVNVRFLPAPYVLFENLRISDTTGIAGGPLFKTDSFKMWLAVTPLLKGVLQANKVELSRPVLALAADRDGYGNWRNLPDVTSLPFVPAGVKLDSVAIEDGTITYSIEQAGELARVEKITGELTAPALAGPYAFRGRAAFNGSQGEVRLGTTEADSSGAFRLTAHLSGWGADDHKFDGQVSGFWERPSVEGSLISRLTVAKAGESRTRPLIAEARSILAASGQTLNLDGLTISFNDFNQPQIVTGSLTAMWAERHKVEVVLDSRWLDIDLLANGQADGGPDGAISPLNSGDPRAPTSRAKKAAAPLPMSRRLIAALLELFPGETDVTARLDVDQVNLGGETVSSLVVAMERSRGPLELRTLRAILPGGARINFSGRVESVGGQPVFDGDLFLGGVSAARVIHWGMGSSDMGSPISDGPFSVSGRMQLGTNRVMLRSAVAEFSGIPIRGSINWDDGKRSVLELIVEGYQVDTRWFGLGKLELPALTEILSVSDDASSQSGTKKGLYGWLHKQGREVLLSLKAGRLVDGSNTFRDVDAQFKMNGSTIQIQRIKLLTAEGLGVDLEGTVKGVGVQPQGKINFVVGARDRAAAWKLADMWAGESTTPADRDRFAALAPIRVAGQMQLGGRLKTAADFTIDGVAGGGRVDARLKLDGGIAGWRRAPIDFVMRSEAVDSRQLFTSLAGGRTPEDDETAARDQGNVLVKAIGVPQSNLLTMMTVESQSVSLLLDGKARITDSGVSSLDGELVLRTGDVRQLVELAGVELPRGVGKIEYDGLADVSWTNGRLVVTPRDVKFAGSRVGGRVTVSTGENGRRNVDGQFVADEGSLPRILSAVLSQPDETPTNLQVAEAEAAVRTSDFAVADGVLSVEAPSIFSDRAFDLSLLDNVTGTIKLTVNRLLIAETLVVQQARAVIRAEADSLKLRVSEASALDGNFEADLTLTKAPAGAVAKGSLAFAQVDVARLAAVSGGYGNAAGRALGSGRADLELNFEGRGLTPRGAISVATGAGNLKLDNVKLVGLSPTGVRYAAEAALAAEQFSSEQLRRLLDEAAIRGRLELGSRDVQLRIADGAVQFDRLHLDQEQGRSTVSMTADLRSLVLDSEWQVEMKDRKAGRPWPPVSVTYVGPLAKLGALEVRVVPDALERELAVRKMEINVNELERLRRLDEEAGARERERRRQLELESKRIEAERAAAAQRNGSGGGAGNSVDGWQATPLPADPGAQDGGLNQQDVQPQESSRPSKRRNRSRPYFRRKQKPKSFPNQVFGFE